MGDVRSHDFPEGRWRVLPLKGGRNFRDIGGYHTSDGRRVRWGVVYRSGSMTYLTQEDHALLAPRRIRVICDFRTVREREGEPTRWPDPTTRTLSWQYDSSLVSLRREHTAGNFTRADARAAIISVYRRFPMAFADVYAEMFRGLAALELPMLVHCAAGKDRTGVACALILSSLGVPLQSVMEDYALTDMAVDLERELFTREDSSVGLTDDHSFLCALAPEVRQPLLKSLPEYLQAAFDQMIADHGSVESYVRDRLHVSADMLAGIKMRLLE